MVSGVVLQSRLPLFWLPGMFALATLSAAVAAYLTATGWSTDATDKTGLLVRPFLAFCTLVALVSGILTAGSVILLSQTAYQAAAETIRLPYSGIVNLTIFDAVILVPVAWNVFALRYVGSNALTSRRTVALVTFPLWATVLSYDIAYFTVDGFPSDTGAPVAIGVRSALLVALVVIIVVTTLTLGSVLRLIYRYGNVPLGVGAALAGQAVGITLLVPMGTQLIASSFALAYGIVAGGFLLTAAGCLLAVSRYDVFASRPSAGTIGEATAIEEMEDGIVVVDEQEKVVTANRTAREVLDGAETDLGGTRLDEVLERDIATLERTPTLELETSAGSRRFAPRVSTITDDSGHAVGSVVNLPDITDRTIREQRIQVLNRVLRHNLRNDLGAVKTRAELLRDEEISPDEAADAIVEQVEELIALGEQAREIENVIAAGGDAPESVSLDEQLGLLVGKHRERYPETTFEVDLSVESLTVNWGVLWYALDNLVDNAARYNDADAPRVRISSDRSPANTLPVRITVADNGPGIPGHEKRVVTEGDESALEHGSGLGLWATKWGVRMLGGELRFDRSELGGAAVTLALPAETARTPE